jgi:predicted outer membrane repeat protein
MNCRFEDNTAVQYGGAIYARGIHPDSADRLGWQHHLSCANCVFFKNSAGQRGGAIYLKYAEARLVNSTLVDNVSGLGGGVYTKFYSMLRVRNSIFRGNSGGNFAGAGGLTVYYSNIQGGHPGIGNINKVPQFVDRANGDLSLKNISPCIDAGRRFYLLDEQGEPIIDTDIAGEPRFVNTPGVPNTGEGSPPVDMGAYEFQP